MNYARKTTILITMLFLILIGFSPYTLASNSTKKEVNNGIVVYYNNNRWNLYTFNETNTKAPIIQVSNLTIPLAGLEGNGTAEFAIFNVIYLPKGTVFNMSAFVCSEDRITNLSVVVFRGNWLGPYDFSHRIKLNQKNSYRLYMPSGMYSVGIIFDIKNTSMDKVHFCNIFLNISSKKGTALVLKPSIPGLSRPFFVVGRHVKEGKVRSISWIYYQATKDGAKIPILNLTNYKKTGKIWACFYTPTKNATLSIVVHAEDLLSEHKLNWYPTELYIWNGSRLDITNLKWNSTFIYNGSDYGLVINPSNLWNFSRNLTDAGDTLRCIGIWVKWDPLLNASVTLSLPANSIVGLTNSSNVQSNSEEIIRQNRITGIELFIVGLWLLVIFLALRQPQLVRRCRFPDWIDDLIRTIRGFFQNTQNLIGIGVCIVLLLAALVSFGLIPPNQLATWGGIIIFILLWVLSGSLLWLIDNEWWSVLIIAAIIIGILRGLINIGVFGNSEVFLFVHFATFLLPLPLLVRSLRIAWEIIDRGSRTSPRLIRRRSERMQLFLSIVLSIFIGPGMVILVYASASILGLINNNISTWQQIVGSSFIISIGTAALLVYECLLLRDF
ncbi:hypothetical protein [Thermococcus sp. 5-4]|uniref:hypothetical protein n=1 Tax=Thermococcus sp. 5-4 TaxID=2008440 RepID=UPI0011AB53A9|nr:hypothetical protein [Thermococcus sp. 5-4]